MAIKKQSNTSTSSKTGIKYVQPTLVLGLGGSGKEVLLRLRQRFFEKYGEVALPAVRYLWLDTDLGNQNVDGKPLDYIKDEVRFKEFEQINLAIPEADYLALFQNRNTKQNLFSWLDPALESLGSVVDGARQIRSLGRLSFFHHAFLNNGIRDHLGKAVDELVSREVRDRMLKEHAVQVGGRLQVILASSLAGGTGSGLFLDLAFLIRDEFRGANPDIIGYFLLPSVFAPDAPHVEALYANAYAALEELEFYSLRKDWRQTEGRMISGADSVHDLRVEWRPGDFRKIPGPPFNVCYLIDNQTRGGGIIGPEQKTDLCDMIAENIFIDFSSEGLAAQKRSVRANLDGQLINPFEYAYLSSEGQVIHRQQFSCRFSTFGVSKIFVPVDYLTNRCAYQLANSLLVSLLTDNEKKAETEESRDKDLGLNIQAIENKLKENNPDLNLRADWMKHYPGLREVFQTKMKKRENAGFHKKFMDKFEIYEKEFEGGELAPLIDLIRSQKSYLQASKQTLQNKVEEWLQAPDCRTLSVIVRLGKLHERLKKHEQHFISARDDSKKNALKAREKMENYLEILLDEELYRRLHYFERQSMFILLRFICTSAAEYFQHKIIEQIHTQAVRFCTEMQNFIGQKIEKNDPSTGETAINYTGLIQQVWMVHEFLKDLKEQVDRNWQSYQRVDSHVIFENLFTPPNDFANYYKLQGGINKQEEDWLKHLSLKRKVSGFLSLPKEREKNGLPALLNDFVAFCRSRFSHLAESQEADAIHMLNRLNRECPQRVTESIKRLVKNGQVWIRPSPLSATDFPVSENYYEAVIWGIAQKGGNVEEYEHFVKTLRPYLQAISSRRRIYPPVDVSHDSVYLYNEYAGIPLMYIARLDEYRKAYKNYYRRHGRSPHIDYNDEKFTDIVILSTEEIQKNIEAQRALLLGVILRVVELKEEEGKFNFYYQDKRSFSSEPIKLGPQRMAVESLVQHEDTTKARIKDEIKIRRDGLAKNVSPWLQYFVTLSCNINGEGFEGIPPGPFPPTWGKEGRTYAPRYPEEHCALSSERDREKEELKKKLGVNEEVLNRLFVEFYEHIDEFSEELPFKDKKLRVLKEDVVEAAISEKNSSAEV